MEPWKARHARVWLAVAAWVAVLCCSSLAMANPQAVPGHQVPDCQLNVLGDQDGSIIAASIRCVGQMPTNVAVDNTLLGKFQADLPRVSATGSCKPQAYCLITVCNGPLVLRDSSVSWVRSGFLENLICVVGSSNLEVYNSQFSHNTVRSLGCFDQACLLLYGSNISHNVAQGSGGGLHAEGGAVVMITGGSRVHNNTARQFGGGVAVWGNANITLTGSSSVSSNVARNRHGGGLAVMENASVTISGRSSVHNNTQQAFFGTGGGLFAKDNSVVVITSNSSVHNNSAQDHGGGVAAQFSATVTITGSSTVHTNSAQDSGGGVAALDNATVTLSGGSSVHNNTALVYGGGVAARDNATVTLSGGSSVHNNTVQYFGGGMCAMQSANVTFSGGSSVHNNTALKVGGGVYANGNATVTLIGGSNVHNNTAHMAGGGLSASDNASVTLTGSNVHNNMAASGGGGGMVIRSNATLTIIQSHVHSNKALNGSGGGVLVADMANVTIAGNCNIDENSCTTGVGGGIAVGLSLDIIKFGEKGLRGNVESIRDADLRSNAIVTISESTIGNNTSYLSAGGGLAVAREATVVLTNGTRIIDNRVVNGSGGGAVLVDRATLHVDTDVSFVDNVVNRGYVGSTIAAFDNSKLMLPIRGDLTKCTTGVYLGRTPCEEGETLLNDVCMCCPRHTFSFGTSACQQCPPHGNCPGGSIVEPIAGYWHSSDRSTEMHRCPLFTAACNHTVMNATTVQTCNNGYQGSLCGACQLPEYGMVSPLKCDKCMHPRAQLGLYLLACFVTIVFIAFTVHATWRDNLKGGQAVRATDLIKVLVQFLQYVVIIGSVSIPWPPKLDLQRWFQAASTVFGAASGQALSLDCWLHRYMPHSALDLAIQRQLVYFLAPVGVLAGVVVLQYLIWAVRLWVVPLFWRPKATDVGRQQRANLVLRKLPVTVLVVTYYAYPTLLRASLSFFACLRIDTAHGPGPLNHALGYWVSDIQQACFAGYHKGWALGLGLPSVLLWCIAVPVAMGVGLKLAGSKADADSFREHFGFLYRNYKPELMWWEAVWTARTVALTLVSVFSFPMGRYFSVICLLVVFLSSAALQTVFKPYAMSTLHNMHIISTSCLAATTIGAQAMFAYDITQESTAEVLRYVITVLVLFFNVVFVGWCGIRLAPTAKRACFGAYAKAKAWAEAVMGYAGKAAGGWRQGKARLHT